MLSALKQASIPEQEHKAFMQDKLL